METKDLTVPIKFCINQNDRRRSRLLIPLTMKKLREAIHTSFPSLVGNNYNISYVDDEGDDITVATDADLLEAYEIFKQIGRVMAMSISTEKDNSRQTPHNWWNNKTLSGMSRPQTYICGRHGLFRRLQNQVLQTLVPSLQQFEENLKAAKNKLDEDERIHQLGLESKFLADVTIPDGHSVSAGEQFQKIWLMDTGSQGWPSGTILQHVGGHALGNSKSIPVSPQEPNQKVELKLMCRAPNPKRTRKFRSKWRLKGPDGKYFGHFVWTEVHVTARHKPKSHKPKSHKRRFAKSDLTPHFGVICDGSGQNPLLGIRYHKIGENFDLNEAEFSKLSAAEKSLFEAIPFPGAPPIPIHVSNDPTFDGKAHFRQKCPASILTNLVERFASQINSDHNHLSEMEAECTPSMIKLGEDHATTIGGDSLCEGVSSAALPVSTISTSTQQNEKTDTSPQDEQVDLPRYSEQEKVLSSMGFHLDQSTLEELMEQVDGSVEQAVNLLC